MKTPTEILSSPLPEQTVSPSAGGLCAGLGDALGDGPDDGLGERHTLHPARKPPYVAHSSQSTAAVAESPLLLVERPTADCGGPHPRKKGLRLQSTTADDLVRAAAAASAAVPAAPRLAERPPTYRDSAPAVEDELTEEVPLRTWM